MLRYESVCRRYCKIGVNFVLLIVFASNLAGCACYMAVLEENKRLAQNEDYIEMQQRIHEANMLRQFR